MVPSGLEPETLWLLEKQQSASVSWVRSSVAEQPGCEVPRQELSCISRCAAIGWSLFRFRMAGFGLVQAFWHKGQAAVMEELPLASKLDE